MTPNKIDALTCTLLMLEVSTRELYGKLHALYEEIEILDDAMEEFGSADSILQSGSLAKLRGMMADPKFVENLKDCKEAALVAQPFVRSLREAVHAAQTDPGIGVSIARLPEVG